MGIGIVLSGATEALSLNYGAVVVSVLFVLYHLLLKSVFYNKFFGVLKERESLTAGKIEKAGRDRRERADLMARYEGMVRDARQECYAVVEKARSEAKAASEASLKESTDAIRRHAEDSKEGFRRSAREARAELEAEIGAFARLAADRVMSREARP